MNRSQVEGGALRERALPPRTAKIRACLREVLTCELFDVHIPQITHNHHSPIKMPLKRGNSKISKGRFTNRKSRKRSKFSRRVARIAKAVSLKRQETQKSTQKIERSDFTKLQHNRTNYYLSRSSNFNWCQTNQGLTNPDSVTPNPVEASLGNRIGDSVDCIGFDLRLVFFQRVECPNITMKFWLVEYDPSLNLTHKPYDDTAFWTNVQTNKLCDYIKTDQPFKILKSWTQKYGLNQQSRITTDVNGATFSETKVTTVMKKWFPYKHRLQYRSDNNTFANRTLGLVMLPFHHLEQNTGADLGWFEGSLRMYFKDNN